MDCRRSAYGAGTPGSPVLRLSGNRLRALATLCGIHRAAYSMLGDRIAEHFVISSLQRTGKNCQPVGAGSIDAVQPTEVTRKSSISRHASSGHGFL